MSVRAFDLVPIIEKVSWANKVRTVIECLECSGKNLYVGTRESFLIHYILETKSQPSGANIFASKKQTQKYLEYKKPITHLKAVPVLSRILLLCDGNLLVLNMADLEINSAMSKIKGVTVFCLNENPEANNPFSIEICVAKKKQLHLYHITDEKIIHLKDISIPEIPVAMAVDGCFACVGMTTKYIVMNMENGYVQELFPYDSDSTVPLVKRITKEEFLLAGPSSLGMFAKTTGISERPPLPWGDNVLAVAYSYPYLVVLDTQFLTVYSILDQKLKQRITFHGGCYMDNFDGSMIVASSDSICALVPVPWEKQVQALLIDKKVEEALELAKFSSKTGLSREQSKKILQKIQQQAGFIEFSQFHFNEAKELFRAGSLDIRELICLYTDILPKSSTFTCIAPPLHDIASVAHMCSNNEELIAQCKQFLIEYLEEIHKTSDAVGCKLEIDTALLKLYSEINSPSLIEIVNSSDSGCDVKESVESLLHFKRYHMLALFHCVRGENEKALQIWARIILGEYSDSSFLGLTFLIDFLARLREHNLVWKYADFVLEKDQEQGVKIFVNRSATDPISERMRPDIIVDYLHRFPVSLLHYLEYLVFEKKLEKEKFHTHLAVLYLDNVLQLLKNENTNSEDVSIARKKLQHLLHFSSLYRVQLLLGKATEHGLHIECAILYGKLEEHEKALQILIHEMQDYSAAEDYCVRMSSGKTQKLRHRLFHILLAAYLDPHLDETRRENLLVPAVHLLNSDLAEFDASKVLQLIPSHWSIAILEQFLKKSLQASLHTKYTSHIHRALSRGENLQVRFTKMHLENNITIMTEDRLCMLCKCPFLEPSFIRFPSGYITHPHCAKLHINTSSDKVISKKSNAR